MQLRVAGAQMPVTRHVGRNLQAIMRAIDFAADEGAAILLTPEGSLSGYTHEIDPAATQAALAEITRRARQKALGLALGTCFIEPGDGKCYNQLRFYAPSGEFLGFHSKILRCATLDDPPKGEIEHFAATPLRTFDLNGITVGGLICNDLWANPECTPMPDSHLTQEFSRLGAKVIFHAVNGGRDASQYSLVTVFHYHQSNLQMRAKAARVWIVTVDNAAPLSDPCSAPCGVIDTQGNWAIKTDPTGEQLFAHTIEL